MASADVNVKVGCTDLENVFSGFLRRLTLAELDSIGGFECSTRMRTVSVCDPLPPVLLTAPLAAAAAAAARRQ